MQLAFPVKMGKIVQAEPRDLGDPPQTWSHDQRTDGMRVVLNIFIHHGHLAFQGQCLWSYCLLLVSLAPNLSEIGLKLS